MRRNVLAFACLALSLLSAGCGPADTAQVAAGVVEPEGADPCCTTDAGAVTLGVEPEIENAPALVATEPAADDCCETEAGAEGASSGGIAVPPGVRENLGITFASVAPRPVAATKRVPGQFELMPTARQEFRAPLGGRVQLEVEQFQRVDENELLFSIDSPEWRKIQHEAVEAEGEITMAMAALDVARAKLDEVRATLARQEARLENLSNAGVRKADLESEVTTLRSSVPRLTAEIRAKEANLREAHEHYASRLNALSTVTGLSIETLRDEANGEAAWRSIGALPVRAQQAGVVETIDINHGGWLEAGELALRVLDPTHIRFHAEAPQGDIALYRDGQTARIVPPQGGTVALDAVMSGTLMTGLTAHERDRTVSLYVTPDRIAPWAKAGVGGFVEVYLTEGAEAQLAIPSKAIIQDGLEHIFFRRDPKNPDRVLRVVADMGPTDGRYTVLRSGAMEGDEVVLDGVYALKLTGSGQQAPPGYHYHADGSLHKDHT